MRFFLLSLFLMTPFLIVAGVIYFMPESDDHDPDHFNS